jgi:hypothetical protein
MFTWRAAPGGGSILTSIDATTTFTVAQWLNVMSIVGLIESAWPNELLLAGNSLLVICVLLLALNGTYAFRNNAISDPEDKAILVLGKPRKASSMAKIYFAFSALLFFLCAIPLWRAGVGPG